MTPAPAPLSKKLRTTHDSCETAQAGGIDISLPRIDSRSWRRLTIIDRFALAQVLGVGGVATPVMSYFKARHAAKPRLVLYGAHS